ncbi:hypothetical protein AMS68_006143 [Peltaster fructicola]|uniref:NAD(P)-binding domain-containing protein n=1 Tax=Peltaster fructicola TaxID=286661 RepID=A0A6H0Y116_9PEZI|nr:hypothetical protein AMS68_006143 [Peltaster fructicola]
MSVAITGVSGHLGSLIAKHVLRRSPTAVVHGICRNPDKLPESLRSNERFKVFQTGHDDAQKLGEALKGANIAIFATLADRDTMVNGQKAVIDACIDAGVPRYMAGDWSLDFRRIKLGDLPPKDPMKHIVEYLQEKEQQTDGKLKGVHVLNGAFMEIIGRGLYKQKERIINVWGSGDDKWDLTTYNDAANFSAALALDPGATGWYSIRGDRVSANDIATQYEAAFGFKAESVHHGSLDDLYKTMHQVRKQQPDNIWAWMGLFYTYYSTNGEGALSDPLSNDKYHDMRMTSLKEYFEAAKRPERIGTPFEIL